MGKNCLEEYLTKSCRNCEFWRNDETACGCACPFPIMECEAKKALKEMRKEEDEK